MRESQFDYGNWVEPKTVEIKYYTISQDQVKEYEGLCKPR